MNNRPLTTAILAMTADGKITDYCNTAARFGSSNDQAHLEQQVSLVDGVIFGAETLRAYGTTLSVRDSRLIAARKERSQLSQPVQIVVSASGNLDSTWRFFEQPVPRWLLTVPQGAKFWQDRAEFDQIIVSQSVSSHPNIVDWQLALTQLQQLGLQKLAILGGGELVASLLAINSLDELWLTVCPLILGGKTAPTPVGGQGWLQSQAKQLRLLEVKQIEQEVFLHYQVKSN